jgi:hypothetical protein
MSTKRRWGVMRMADDPWRDIPQPSSIDSLNARRVDADMPWNFFWARGIDGRCQLILRHASESSTSVRLPRLRDIDISLATSDGDRSRTLVFRLLDSSHRDIFYNLCLDIMGAAADADSEREAVAVTLARTWRWHHLLRGGEGRLSPEEQKGLIGELLVLERLLLSRLSAMDAVSSWRGPLGAPKDFEVGRIALESKARRAAATPFVAISSEHQLDTSGVDALFLHVVELDEGPSDATDNFTVSFIVDHVRNEILSTDEGAVDKYDSLLLAAGFRPDDDYSDSCWVEGKSRLYHVAPGFPRISVDGISTGITNVRYSVALKACEPFLCDESALEAALKGGRDAH